MLGSLTVAARAARLLGRRVDKGRIPLVRPPKPRRQDSRVWGAVLDRVLRRPLVAVVLAGGAAGRLAPALHSRRTTPASTTCPRASR